MKKFKIIQTEIKTAHTGKIVGLSKVMTRTNAEKLIKKLHAFDTETSQDPTPIKDDEYICNGIKTAIYHIQ